MDSDEEYPEFALSDEGSSSDDEKSSEGESIETDFFTWPQPPEGPPVSPEEFRRMPCAEFNSYIRIKGGNDPPLHFNHRMKRWLRQVPLAQHIPDWLINVENSEAENEEAEAEVEAEAEGVDRLDQARDVG